MERCLELARKAIGYVAPNPMVGAVLVHENRIIGEGWHREFGQAHAEVNCIDSVIEDDKKYIAYSTLYVSLEPCSHFGKTPPCADLIIKNGIQHVVIGSRDPFPDVNGKGIEKLRSAGINVSVGLMEDECIQLNKRFFTFYNKHRPYIILKWAETADGKLSSGSKERLKISNEYSNRLVHQWRSEEASIMIGTNTALYDDPELTTRLWQGRSPTRLVVDMNLRLPTSLKIFNNAVPTIIFNGMKHKVSGNILFYQLNQSASLVQQVVDALYREKIQSVMVEGGAKLLQSFIDSGYWDEARVITNNQHVAVNGLSAPAIENFQKTSEFNLDTDTVRIYLPYENNDRLL